MDIQRLSPDEWKRSQQIRLAALRDAPQAFGSTIEAAEKHSETEWRQQVEEMATFVAAVGGQDIGVVRGMPDEADPGRAFLISLWVAPDARRKGAGRRLIQAVESWAREAGFT